MHSYKIADFLIRVKNGYLASKDYVEMPYSKTLEVLADLLVKKGYLAKKEIEKIDKVKSNIKVKLIYVNKKPKLTNVKIESKPGRKIYINKDNIPKVLSGIGISIVSTSKGIMTGKDAKKEGIGGELLCLLW